MNLQFDDACSKFLEYEKSEVSLQTYDLICRNFKLHIIPYFKNKKISDIGLEDILKWEHSIEEKGYTYEYNSSLYTKMCQLYNFLITFYGVKVNVMKTAPKFKNNTIKKRNTDIWTKKEFNKFIKVSKKDVVYNSLFEFMFLTGARIGEVSALRFSDIDNDYVIISKSLSKITLDGKRVIQPTKTKKIRKIRIDRKIKHKIDKLRKYYIKKYDDFNTNFYIFGGNKPLSLTTIKRKKDNYCDKAHVKRIRIHDFRHSNATIIYNKTKNAKLVQYRLGHQKIDTTFNYYVHISKDEEKRAIKALKLLRFNIF